MDQKKEVYLLDTNAYFNFLRYATKALGDDDTFNETIEKIRDAECYISQVSLLEIISVLGKYSRGNSGGKEKCNCIIDEHGTICPNFKYTTKKNKWSKKRKKAWIKYFEEIKQGTSDILSIHVLPLDAITWAEAEKIIMLSLDFKFASMDALIAATAKVAQKNENMQQLKIITSDKSLKTALQICALPVWDAFKPTPTPALT